MFTRFSVKRIAEDIQIRCLLYIVTGERRLYHHIHTWICAIIWIHFLALHRSLYNTFASPWPDTPCRPQDIGEFYAVLIESDVCSAAFSGCVLNTLHWNSVTYNRTILVPFCLLVLVRTILLPFDINVTK